MPDSNSTVPYPQILVIGDSIVRRGNAPGGYVARLADEYSGKFDVLNRGYGGYTSRQLLRKLQDDFYQTQTGSTQVKLVVLHIGTNDSVLFGRQYVPLSEYRSNLHSILTLLRTNHPSASLLLISPSTCDPIAWRRCNADGSKDRSAENVKLYSGACIEVAREMGVVGLDAWGLLEGVRDKGLGLEELLTDGLHFTGVGYQFISDAMMGLIRLHFPELNPDDLPLSFVTSENY